MEHNFQLKERVYINIGEKSYKAIVVGFLHDDLVLIINESEPFKQTQLTVHYSLLEKDHVAPSVKAEKKGSGIIIANVSRHEEDHDL